MTSLILCKSFFHSSANTLMVYPCAKFNCDRSTNNDDAGGWMPLPPPPPPQPKMSKKPSLIRVKQDDAFIRMWWPVLLIDKLITWKQLSIEKTGHHIMRKASS